MTANPTNDTQKALMGRVEATVAELGNKMDAVTIALAELTTEVRIDREQRAKSDAAHDVAHADYDRRLSALETWRTVQETKADVTPPLTWGRLFADARVWLVMAASIVGATVAALSYLSAP